MHIQWYVQCVLFKLFFVYLVFSFLFMCSYILQTVMDKYLIKAPKKRTSEQSSVGDKLISKEIPSTSLKKISLEFNPEELISDPGLRPPIASYDVNECGKIRRAYLSKPPCQPKGHAFPFTDFGGKRCRFNSAWFSEYKEWLKYSVEKDAAFCLYCYLFPETGVDPAFVTR